MKKSSLITLEMISYVLILLFMYAALAKVFQFNLFVEDLGRQKLIAWAAPALSILLPAVEILISVMIFFPRTRLKGLYAYLITMVVFTFYVGYAIYIADDTPCTCGGLIRDLTWRQHLLFNLFFVALTIWAVYLERKRLRLGGNDNSAMSFSRA